MLLFLGGLRPLRHFECVASIAHGVPYCCIGHLQVNALLNLRALNFHAPRYDIIAAISAAHLEPVSVLSKFLGSTPPIHCLIQKSALILDDITLKLEKYDKYSRIIASVTYLNGHFFISYNPFKILVVILVLDCWTVLYGNLPFLLVAEGADLGSRAQFLGVALKMHFVFGGQTVQGLIPSTLRVVGLPRLTIR